MRTWSGLIGRSLVLGGWLLGGCSGEPDDVPPTKPAPVDGVVLDLYAPPTCDDLGSERGWRDALCESNGDGTCGGGSEATADCARCCEAPLVTSAELAARRGWAHVACETDDDQACDGYGEATSDCVVACEAPASPPTCAEVAAEWGFEQPRCENADSGACGGEGPATSDCAHCCDAPLEPDPESLNEDGTSGDEDEFPMPDDSEEAFASAPADEPPPGDDDDFSPPPLDQPPVPSPPGPDKACGVLGTEKGWDIPTCEYGGNNACNGQGPATTDCAHCCPRPGAATKCGNNVCDTSETCSSCSKDCGQCLNLVEVNLDGVTSKAQLHRVKKSLHSWKPRLVTLQRGTRSQVDYLATKLQTLSYDYAVEGTVGGRKVGNAVLGSYQVKHVKTRRLSGGASVLDQATFFGPYLSIDVGSTRLSSAASQGADTAARALDKKLGLLGAALGGTTSSAAYKKIDHTLDDGWPTSKQGHTTDVREDFLFRGETWDPAVKSQVVGPSGGSLHRAVGLRFTIPVSPTGSGALCKLYAYNCRLPNYQNPPGRDPKAKPNEPLGVDRNRVFNEQAHGYKWAPVSAETPIKDGANGVRGYVRNPFKINYGQFKHMGGAWHVYGFAVDVSAQPGVGPTELTSGWVPLDMVVDPAHALDPKGAVDPTEVDGPMDSEDWVLTGGDLDPHDPATDADDTLVQSDLFTNLLKVNRGITLTESEKAADYLVRNWNPVTRRGYINFTYNLPGLGIGGVSRDTLPLCVAHFRRYKRSRQYTAPLYRPRCDPAVEADKALGCTIKDDGTTRSPKTIHFVYGTIDGRPGWVTREVLTEARNLKKLNPRHPCYKP